MFALEVWSSRFSQVLDTCLRAERLGFDGFYYGESPTGLNLDCWTTLAALAQATDRIRLGPVITNVLDDYRSLALLARQAATVAIVSDGRLDFRTGAGAAERYGRPWWEPFGVAYGCHAERLIAVDRAISVLRPFWLGQPVEFVEGRPVHLGFGCPPIPVTLAATGPRGMALALDVADVWETSFRTPAELAEQRRAFGQRADGTAPRLSLEIDGFVGTTAARAEQVVARARAERAGEDIEVVLGRALVGEPPMVADQIRSLRDAGVEQFVVALHDPHDADALDALASAVALVS